MKGQITGMAAIIGSVLLFLGTVGTASITANSTIKDRVAEVDRNASIVATRLEVSDKNTSNRLDRLENKIDWLMRNQGGNPTLITSSSTATNR